MWKLSFPAFCMIALLTIIFLDTNFASLRFKKLRCTIADPSFGRMITCKIKLIGRNSSTVQLHGVFNQTVHNSTIRIRFMRWLSGWRPHLFDIKVDPCIFVQKPDKYFFANLILVYLQFTANVSRLHPCPYLVGEELFVESPDLNEKIFLSYFPFPYGEYGLFFDVFINNKHAGDGMCSVVYGEEFKAGKKAGKEVISKLNKK